MESFVFLLLIGICLALDNKQTPQVTMLQKTTALKRTHHVRQTTKSVNVTSPTFPTITPDFCKDIKVNALLMTRDKHVYVFHKELMGKMNVKNASFLSITKVKDIWKEVGTPVTAVSHLISENAIAIFQNNLYWVYKEKDDYKQNEKLVYKGQIRTKLTGVTFQAIEVNDNSKTKKVQLCNSKNVPLECNAVTKNEQGMFVLELDDNTCNNHSASVYNCIVRDYIDIGDIAYLALMNGTHLNFVDTRDNDITYNVEKQIFKCQTKVTHVKQTTKSVNVTSPKITKPVHNILNAASDNGSSEISVHITLLASSFMFLYYYFLI